MNVAATFTASEREKSVAMATEPPLPPVLGRGGHRHCVTFDRMPRPFQMTAQLERGWGFYDEPTLSRNMGKRREL
jgi:hypothetical protein